MFMFWVLKMQHSFEESRKKMVDGQLKPSRITDRALLAALGATPREVFFPRHLQSFSYADEDVQITADRYIQEPVVLGRLLQAAQVKIHEVVLDIGCLTGYSTTILSRLAATVIGLESDPSFSDQAVKNIQTQGVISAIIVQQTDLSIGYVKQSPYDVIVINGSVSAVPQKILDQLAEGGRLVTVVSVKGQLGRAMIYRRSNGVISSETLFDASTPVLKGFEHKQVFTL
jgi:protein-L-isoaspartate(D-aspartate) O-methyltransferase